MPILDARPWHCAAQPLMLNSEAIRSQPAWGQGGEISRVKRSIDRRVITLLVPQNQTFCLWANKIRRGCRAPIRTTRMEARTPPKAQKRSRGDREMFNTVDRRRLLKCFMETLHP